MGTSFKVENHIRQAISRNNKGLDKMEVTLSAARVYLRDERGKPANWYDIDMAAAEHYMLMRWLVCKTGDRSVLDAPTLYLWKKTAYFAVGQQKRLQTGAGPVLPPDATVEAYGIRGAAEGWADYLVIHPGASSNTGAGWAWLAKEAARF
jgi:hypothetical protein